MRLSRSKKSGASKHYAWLEFSSAEVAGIAAGAMDGYMLFTQKLQARVLSQDEVHPKLFKGANRVFKKVRRLPGVCVRGAGVQPTPPAAGVVQCAVAPCGAVQGGVQLQLVVCPPPTRGCTALRC